MADLVGACWTQPDHGIWEIRERRRHYVHSKVWSWVALERAERLVRRHGMPTSAAWEQTRRAIRRTVLTTGYSYTRRSFVQVLGGTHLDASVLTFPLCGFIPAQDPRMLSTLTAVQRVLGKGPLLPHARGASEGRAATRDVGPRKGRGSGERSSWFDLHTLGPRSIPA
jgi:GH15 family glucan-1,4-alpha-glucosidase